MTSENITPVVTSKAPAAIGPYSQGIIAGPFVFTSGQIPINPATSAMPEGAVEQSRQSLENIKAILEAAGSSLDKVVKVTIFLQNMEDFAAINEVYSGYFKTRLPARSCVQVARLPKDALVEIEAIALL